MDTRNGRLFIIAGERAEGFRPRIDAQNRTLEADRVIRAAGVLYVRRAKDAKLSSECEAVAAKLDELSKDLDYVRNMAAWRSASPEEKKWAVEASVKAREFLASEVALDVKRSSSRARELERRKFVARAEWETYAAYSKEVNALIEKVTPGVLDTSGK